MKKRFSEAQIIVFLREDEAGLTSISSGGIVTQSVLHPDDLPGRLLNLELEHLPGVGVPLDASAITHASS